MHVILTYLLHICKIVVPQILYISASAHLITIVTCTCLETSDDMVAYMSEVVNKLRTNGRTECIETHCVAYCKTLPVHPIQ